MKKEETLKVGRRGFVKLGVLGGVAAGSAGCSRIADELVPTPLYRRLRGPEKIVTTACGVCPAGCGINVRVVGGNAVRVTGIEDHAVSGGAVCPQAVGEIQNLYHPDRLRAPLVRRWNVEDHQSVHWAEALDELAEQLRGADVVIGVGPLPAAERDLLNGLATRLNAHVVAVGLPLEQAPLDAMRRMLGSADFVSDLGHSDYVLSLGADWLQATASPVETQRAFADLRRGMGYRGMAVTAGPRLSMTAAHSDRWIPVATTDLPLFGMSLAQALLGAPGDRLAAHHERLAAEIDDFVQYRDLVMDERCAPETVGDLLGLERGAIERVARELAQRARPTVVTDRANRGVQIVGMGINLLLGAVGREGGLLRRGQVPFADRLFGSPATATDGSFPVELRAPVVLLFNANPLHLCPAGSGWADGMARATYTCSFAPFLDETAQACDMVLPLSTPLEEQQLAWGSTQDGRAHLTVGSAAVERLYHTRGAGDAIIALARAVGAPMPWGRFAGYVSAMADAAGAAELVDWGGSKVFSEGDDTAGEDAESLEVEEGAQEAEGPEVPAGQEDLAPDAPQAPPPPPPAVEQTFAANELVGLAEPPPIDDDYPLTLTLHVPLAFHGGRGAHIPFLHALTGPEGREVWRTVVEINTGTAEDAGIVLGARVWVESERGRIEAIAVPREGVHPGSVAVAVGLGRRGLGPFSDGFGANPIELLTSLGDGTVQWATTRVRIRRTV